MEIFSDAAAFGEQRVTGTRNGNFLLFMLLSVSSLLTLTLVLWPIAALVRSHYHFPLTLGSFERKMRKWTKIVCSIDLAVLIGWFAYLSYAFGEIDHASHRVDWVLYLIHVVQIFAIAGTIIPILYALGAWFSKNRWKWNRLFDLLTAAACVGFVWILWSCNFIHFWTKY